MIKNKTFFILLVIFLLNFNNLSFAAEDTELNSRYPDYAYEFTGKDTCEKFNRKIFAFNLKANKYIIRPVNIVWASIMPKYGMDRLQSAYNNINYPVRLFGCLLQKDFKSSKSETVRFLTNTTMGVGGLYDPALTKFKIEPRKEDMAQVLAYHNIKKGPYLVLPIVAQGNIRDLAGQALDLPLNPTSYVFGPIAAIAKGITTLNGTAYMQPIIKMIDETYADPYEVTRKIYGIERYIRNTNLDRKEVLKEKIDSQNIIKVSNVPENSGLKCDLKCDIKLNDYNPQCPLVDSMRSMLFDSPKKNESIWSDLSVWNRNFNKQIKISSVNIDPKRPNYKYRYILQKNKTAPLAVIYPSIGEGIMSNQSVTLAKLLYDEGYSVAIQGSAFQWEFVKSMPDNYKPGMPSQDAYYSRIVTSKIISSLQKKKDCNFSKKILVGTSFGGLTTLFVAAQEEKENTLGISNYISICPPIKIFFALEQLDKYSQDWKNNPSDIKLRAAITAGKIIQVFQNVSKIGPDGEPDPLPLTEEEAKLAIGFTTKQKLSDVIFSIEKYSSPNKQLSNKTEFYQSVNNMSYDDYAQKYLHAAPESSDSPESIELPISIRESSLEKLSYDTSLYSLTNFLHNNKQYKIYHSLDDFFVNPEQLVWLKKQSCNKSIFYSNGSHLGFLYRKEFIDDFKNQIKLQNTLPEGGV